MKTNTTGQKPSSHPQVNTMKKPENKNNLDSREGEEQFNKKDDTTHNKKAHHSELKSQHKK
jgi:hypothetical protein